mmetsp:Transcript_6835/g.13822  ORF Transcript_6835/g.13822 Transcript_6835/m.13822 type:complete len:321 (-) Transcript_6835:1048-2010(-)
MGNNKKARSGVTIGRQTTFKAAISISPGSSGGCGQLRRCTSSCLRCLPIALRLSIHCAEMADPGTGTLCVMFCGPGVCCVGCLAPAVAVCVERAGVLETAAPRVSIGALGGLTGALRAASGTEVVLIVLRGGDGGMELASTADGAAVVVAVVTAAVLSGAVPCAAIMRSILACIPRFVAGGRSRVALSKVALEVRFCASSEVRSCSPVDRTIAALSCRVRINGTTSSEQSPFRLSACCKSQASSSCLPTTFTRLSAEAGMHAISIAESACAVAAPSVAVCPVTAICRAAMVESRIGFLLSARPSIMEAAIEPNTFTPADL